MSETWEQTKARLKKMGIGLPNTKLEDEIVIIPPTPRYDKPVPASEPIVPLWEVRKILLPIDPEYPQGQVIVTGLPEKEAAWWVEFVLKPKSYNDDTTDMKTFVFYEKFLIEGTPRERSIYSNPERFCTEEFPHFNNPKRIN